MNDPKIKQIVIDGKFRIYGLGEYDNLIYQYMPNIQKWVLVQNAIKSTL